MINSERIMITVNVAQPCALVVIFTRVFVKVVIDVFAEVKTDIGSGVEVDVLLDTPVDMGVDTDVSMMANAFTDVMVDLLVSVAIVTMTICGISTLDDAGIDVSSRGAIAPEFAADASDFSTTRQASLPSNQVWSKCEFLTPPQFMNQAPPGAQQLSLPDFLKTPHFVHGTCILTALK